MMSKRGRPVTEQSQAKKDKVVELYQGDKKRSLEEIGKLTGLTRQRVSQILSEQEVFTDEPRINLSAELERILRLSGMSEEDLAEILSVGQQALNRWLRHGVRPEIPYQRRINILLAALEYAQRQAS